MERNCGNCKYRDTNDYNVAICKVQKGMPNVNLGDNCKNWECKYESNGDRLRAMTDDDFARFMYRYGGCPPTKPEACLAKCNKCWERWLKEEAKNDE